MTESLCFCLKMLDTPQGFFGSLPIVNVEVYPDPVQQPPIARSERFEATEEPAVFPFGVSYSEGRLAGSPSSVTGCPDLKRLFMIIGMYQLDVGVPRCIDLHAEPKRIILGETKVIRVSLIHKRKRTGRQCVPCVCRNRIESLSQLCRKRWFLPRSAVYIRSVDAVGVILRRHSHASPIKPYVPSAARADTISVWNGAVIISRPRTLIAVEAILTKNFGLWRYLNDEP
jgi:hypothetical protein